MPNPSISRAVGERREARRQRVWANRTRMFNDRLSKAKCAHERLGLACDLMRAAAIHLPCDDIEPLAASMVTKAYEVNDR